MAHRAKRLQAACLYVDSTLTIAEVAEKLKLNRVTVGRWCKSGKWVQARYNRLVGERMQEIERKEEQAYALLFEVDRLKANPFMGLESYAPKQRKILSKQVIAELAKAFKKIQAQSAIDRDDDDDFDDWDGAA